MDATNSDVVHTGPTRESQGVSLNREALLDAILNADPGGLAVVGGPQLTFLYANPTYRYLCPNPDEDILGMAYDEVWQGESSQTFCDEIKQAVAYGRPFQADGFERHFPDSSWRVFSIQVIPISWDDQRAALVALWDITSRKQAEHELKSAGNYWRTIVENIQDWEYWLDPQGRFLYNSQSCEGMTGYTLAEWNANPSLLLDITHPEDKAEVEAHFRREAAGAGKGVIIYRILTPDGQVRWLDHLCQPVISPEGAVLGTRVSNRDVTRYKRIEELYAYQSVLLDHLSEAVIASDADYKLTAWNKAAEELYGWKAEEVLGRPGLEIIQTQFPDSDKENMLAAISATGNYIGEATQVRKDGTRFQVEVRSTVLRDQSGQIIGYLSINRDITNQRRDQAVLLDGMARIEVQRRLLEHREQERQQIARDLHDINIQELTGITYQLHDLMSEDLSPEIRQKLAEITEQVKAQSQDLRSYASELRPPIMSSFGVGKAIRAHVEGYQAKHPELKINFEDNQVGGLLPEHVRLALFRIYQESLSNIAKHAQATEIQVRLIKTEAEAFLEIKDNGAGFEIPSDWLDLARHGHLGLVGMRERAEAVGGVLTPFSTPGEGTRICVVVPLIQAGGQAQEGQP